MALRFAYGILFFYLLLLMCNHGSGARVVAKQEQESNYITSYGHRQSVEKSGYKAAYNTQEGEKGSQYGAAYGTRKGYPAAYNTGEGEKYEAAYGTKQRYATAYNSEQKEKDGRYIAAYDPKQGYDAAYSSQQVKNTGYDAAYSNQQVQDTGYDAAYSSQQVKNTGYNAAYSNQRVKTTGYNAAYSNQQVQDTGYDAAYSSQQVKDTGYNAAYGTTQGYRATYSTKQGVKGLNYGAAYGTKQDANESGYKAAYGTKQDANESGYKAAYGTKQDAKESGYKAAYRMKQDVRESGYKAAYGMKEDRKGILHCKDGNGVKSRNSHMDHSEAFKVGLFTMDDLYVGRTMAVNFPIEEFPHFLPRKEADSIPFSTPELSNVLQLFSIPTGSPYAKSMGFTLQQCEAPPIMGEIKFCATSLESMLDFVSTIMGSLTNVNLVTTTHPTMSTALTQNYTVLRISKEFFTPKWVVCHPLPFPYKVFYCHFQEKTKIFKVSLGGENGQNVESVAVCHMDTSEWNPDNNMFRQLGVKPGSTPVCHFLPIYHLVWVPSPTIASI